MPPNSFVPPEFVHSWGPQQGQEMRQQWMNNFGFPYFPPNTTEKDLSVRLGATALTVATNQEPSTGIVRNKSATGLVENIDIVDLIPNPPQSPQQKSAIKSLRKDIASVKGAEEVSLSEVNPQVGRSASIEIVKVEKSVSDKNVVRSAAENAMELNAEFSNSDKSHKPDLKVARIDTENVSSKSAVSPATALPPAQLHSLGSVAHNLASTVPGVVSQEKEFNRLAAMYSLGFLNSEGENPRLNKITQMTAKLLGRSCCVLSLVDTDKVYWKSVAWSGLSSPKDITEEPRYESFCSWVVQDESGRGVTILDAKTDPRCTHMRLKQGLEFYAGVPILLGGKHKIGALSIQGPAAAQISVVDMNILHEMATWASGELDTIIRQRQINDREGLLRAREKLSVLPFAVGGKENNDPRIMEKSLAMVRDALNAQFVLLLKLLPDSKGFQSVLQVYSVASNAHTIGSLPVGEEMFKELCIQTLKKETSKCLLIENLKTGAITKDVDRYLSKNINRCLGEVVWSSNGPSAVLAVFFDGVHRTVSQDEMKFVKDIIPTISTMLEQQELQESFLLAATVYKTLGAAAKKHTIAFGASQGLAPCFLVLEPKMTLFKGYPPLETIFTASLERVKENPPLPIQTGAKGQALAQQIALNEFSLTTQIDNRGPETINTGEIFPIESFEIINDLSAMLDNLSEKHGLKKPRRIGQQVKICLKSVLCLIQLRSRYWMF